MSGAVSADSGCRQQDPSVGPSPGRGSLSLRDMVQGRRHLPLGDSLAARFPRQRAEPARHQASTRLRSFVSAHRQLRLLGPYVGRNPTQRIPRSQPRPRTPKGPGVSPFSISAVSISAGQTGPGRWCTGDGVASPPLLLRCEAPGCYRAAIMQRALKGHADESIPASLLQRHPNAWCFVDAAAGKLL